jgi:uncharacterized membrane protein
VLVNGGNPYTDAVRFFNGSPTLPDDAVLEGYPYPAVVLFTYGLVAAFTDPRLISTLAWLVVLAWAAWPVLAKGEDGDASLAIYLVLATFPGWSLLWYASWTEPLSLVLFLAVLSWWRRGPVVSGLLLGLALASKQYLVFLAPLLMLYRDHDWMKRIGVAVSTVLVVLLPPLLLDPSAFYTSTIGNLAAIGFRPDSVSITGLLDGFGIRYVMPQVLWLAIALGVAVLVGRGASSEATLLARAGIVLGVAFALGLAFANYWFLVLGMFGVSTLFDARDRTKVMAST